MELRLCWVAVAALCLVPSTLLQNCDEFTAHRPVDTVAAEGNQVCLFCDYPDEVTEQWERDTTSIRPDVPSYVCDCQVSVGRQPVELCFNSVSPADTGSYTCAQQIGFGLVHSCTVTLSLAAVPNITNKPSNPNITLSIGATRTIYVMYSQGNLPATVEWRKDGQLISDGRVTTNSTESTLTLTNLGPEVRGRYNVTVFNIGGSDSFVYNVKAEFAPIIDLTQSPISSGYRLTCTAVGYPILNQVRWETVDGNSVPGSNDRISQSESATFDFSLTSILDIESSSCDRNGYRCIVSNSPRTSSRSISVCPDVVEPLVLNFINDSPRVQGNNISVDVQTSRPVLTIQCALTGRPSQDCSSGSTTFSNVAPRENDRPYILRVAAITSNGVRTVLRRVVRIEQPNICAVHLINDGVTVSGNSATVEFASTGPSNAFLCSLDRQDPVSCKSGQQLSSLSAGNHRLKIVADNCGSNRHSLVARFIVAEDEA